MSENKQTAATSYACEAQQRLLAVQTVLAGNEVNGLSLTEIVKALESRMGGNQKNNVFRDLHNLKLAGYAEQLPDSDRWRLGPKLVQIATSYQRYMDRAAARLDETRQRFGREFN